MAQSEIKVLMVLVLVRFSNEFYNQKIYSKIERK